MDVIKFLDDLCNTESNKDISAGFNHEEKSKLDIIDPSSWMEWIKYNDGETKLRRIVEFANNNKNPFIISRMQDISSHVIKISKDSSASEFIFEYPFWKRVSKVTKKRAQSFFSLPYIKISLEKNDVYDMDYDEYVINESKWEYDITEVITPSSDDEIYRALEVLTSILIEANVIIYYDSSKPNFNIFTDDVINAVIKMDKDKIADTESFRYMFNRLFYILFDPDNHGLDEYEEFILYMMKNPKYFEFLTDDGYEYLSRFVENATKYLKVQAGLHLLDWELIKIPAENEFWSYVCKRIFIQGFHNADIPQLNRILKNNKLFRKQMIKCAKESPYNVPRSQKIWNDATEHMNLKESGIYKDSKTGGYIAELLYLTIGSSLEHTLSEDYKKDIKQDYDADSLNQLTQFLVSFHAPKLSREPKKRRSSSKSRKSASKRKRDDSE